MSVRSDRESVKSSLGLLVEATTEQFHNSGQEAGQRLVFLTLSVDLEAREYSCRLIHP